MAQSKMAARAAARKTVKHSAGKQRPKPTSRVRFVRSKGRLDPKAEYRDISDDWPRFETVVISPCCCENCGHILVGPRAAAILDLSKGGPMPNTFDPAYQRLEAQVEARAMEEWLATPVGKAWLRHKAKPSKARYLALKKLGGAK